MIDPTLLILVFVFAMWPEAVCRLCRLAFANYSRWLDAEEQKIAAQNHKKETQILG